MLEQPKGILGVSPQPIISTYDKKTGMYYRIESQDQFTEYWQSELLYLEYINHYIIKQYDPDIEKTGYPTTKIGHLFCESTEYFSISEKDGFKNYSIFLDNEQKKEEQKKLKNNQEKIDKESDKL